MSPLIALRRFIMAVLRVPVALWLLFEEWGWEPLQAALASLLGAKLLGTAVVARLFTLIRPSLMRLAWFTRVYQRDEGWKNRMMDWVRTGPVWRMARKLKTQMKRWWQRGR
jgi:hypothetical protein